MKTLIDEIRGEHAVILTKLDELEALVEKGETPDVPAFIEFYDTYVEARHLTKEEGLLFPRMRRDANLRQFLDKLADEHEDERRLIERLRAGGDPVALLAMYLENLRWHILKENAMFFEAATHLVTQ